MQWLYTWLLLCLIGLSTTLMQAEPSPSQDHLEQIDFYLHTTEVGNLLFDNFGHSALILHDKKLGRHLVYNWGIFDFSHPISFASRFYLGDLNYKLGIYPYFAVVSHYPDQNRTVWSDKFNLSTAEKAQLLRRLAWNAKPENRHYMYQYFFENCSTRIRDYIDEAVGGWLKTQTQTMSSTSYRAVVDSHYRTNPSLAMLLHIGMNSNLDRTMTLWEQMFLPKSLRAELLNTTKPDGQPLLSHQAVLTTAPPIPPAPLTGFQYFSLFISGLLICGFYKSSWGHRLGSLGISIYLLYTGILGPLMLASWLLSGHIDLHHNWNLMIFWPLDALFLGYCGYALRHAQPKQLSHKISVIITRYRYAHLAMLGLYSVAYFFIDQNIQQVLIYCGPLALYIWGPGFQHIVRCQLPPRS